MTDRVEPGPLARERQEAWRRQMAAVGPVGKPWSNESWASRLSRSTAQVAAGVEPVGGVVPAPRRRYRAVGCLAAVLVAVLLFLIVTGVAASIAWWTH